MTNPVWAWLLLLCLLASSCRPPAPSPPPEGPPSPAGMVRAYPQASPPVPEAPKPFPERPSDLEVVPARGRINGQPFPVRSALLWQGPAGTFLSIASTVPVTGGRFDPRARQATDTRLVIFLDPSRVKEGHWIVRSQAGSPDPTCPVLRVALQLPRTATGKAAERPQPGLRASVVDTDWALSLRIDQVVRRKALDGSDTLSLAGAMACRFARPPSWVDGAFVARDTLRDDEVAPGQPQVPAPIPPVSASPSPPR